MDSSHHAAFGGDPADIMGLSLNFDSIMAQDLQLSADLDAFTTGIHDDSCLGHSAYSHCGANSKAHAKMNPPPKPSPKPTQRPQSAMARSRAPQRISKPQVSQFAPSWDAVFTESLMAQSNACSAFDACNDICNDTCDDNDCASASCISDCDGACPSQCPDEVCHDEVCHDEVCCEDDHCAPADLCLDQNCHGTAAPCSRPVCSLSDNEAAAAAALTSFGDNLMPPPTITTSAVLDADLANMGLPEVPCSSLALDGPLAEGMSSFTDQIWGVPPEFILANHIMQYHDPSHQATSHVDHNCIAGNPSSIVSMCSLPKHTDNSTLGDGVCGFPVHDPQSFAQHIFQQHRPALMQHGSFLKKEELSSDPNYAQYFNGQQLSASASPNTNLSMGTSVSPTPVSLPTPSPMDAQHYFLDLNTGTKQEATSLGIDSPFMCRWVGPNGQACGKVCTGHKELQEHCKTDHLKEIKKDHAGFYCQWQGCTRHTTFSQRSKLERHMQVHTGCKSSPQPSLYWMHANYFLVKPVECKICGAQLSAKQSLEQHMRTHTGEKPWVCTFPGCKQAFKQQSALSKFSMILLAAYQI